ncbi:phage tail tape measure C-terminal domain-containing protein [Roseovarius sp. MBR-6]|jgi:hypothetical protein|uniref:phage tail tape measure C-terminal domain-containing protein n=1 Tax=Roseovarius sp. MBR-6 TaxID=3156459 RepID=UPI003390C642
MMQVSAKLTADEKEMVAALRRARDEMEKVRGSTRATGQSARDAATGTGQLTRAQQTGAAATARARIEAERSTRAQAASTQASDRLRLAKSRTRTETVRATAATQAFSGAMSNAAASAALINGPLGGVASRFSTVASLSGRMNLALVGSVVGVSALSLAATRAIRSFADYERQQLTLQGALNATGFAAGRTADQINATARRIAVDTLASSREVRAAATALLTFRSVAGETFDRTLELSQDLAASGFGTLEGNAVQLGKALEDPLTGLTALTRVGVSFSPVQKELIRNFAETGRLAEAQKVILEGVAAQVAGTGAAAGGGLAGGFDLLSENMTRFFEIIGENLNNGSRFSEVLALVGQGVGQINDLLDAAVTDTDRSREIVGENERLLELLNERQRVLDQLEQARGQGDAGLELSLSNILRFVDQRVATSEAALERLTGVARASADEQADVARKSAEAQAQIAKERVDSVFSELDREIEEVRRSELANAQRAAQLKAGVAADSEAGAAIAARVAELFAEREASEAAARATDERRQAGARAREAVEDLLGSLRGEIEVMRSADPVMREMIRLRGELAGATDDERAAIEGLIAVKRVEAALGDSRTEIDRLRDRVAGARDRATAEARFGNGPARGAEREAFLLAASEERRLRAAGLEGAELQAAVSRIRAEAEAALASAPDAFFGTGERERGGAAAGRVREEVDIVSKVFEEFGQRFGGTMEFQQRQIEDWRATTIAQLRAAGFGHERYAEMVNDIARDRLKEAYEQDLQNRDDWQAGIERGLNDVFGAQITMAEVAEETVKATFSGMEDAFVSLAKTGKLETADMVDFVLRQLFRLGAAAAAGNLSSAGGGIFGNIFGGLFNGLFSGPAPGSTASILHEGGIAGVDGSTRLVSPTVFAGARRLHIGGLAGNEVPAILEDDERVMTLAQQQATAATIRGLARLSTAPRGPSAGGTGQVALNLSVNVVGAEGEPRVESRQNGDQIELDIIFNEVEGRLGRNIAQGRGLAPVIGQRFNIRGGL